MKILMLAVVLALWAGYALHRDRRPVPSWYHPAIHLLYAALLAGVVLL